MPVAQECRSCEDISLKRKAFCTIFLCVSGEWRRIEDPFIRTSRHDRVRVPDAKNFDALSMRPCGRRSLRSWKDRYLFASLIRVTHMKCSNARDTWLSWYLLLALLAANSCPTLPGKTNVRPWKRITYVYFELYINSHIRVTKLVEKIQQEKINRLCVRVCTRRY